MLRSARRFLRFSFSLRRLTRIGLSSVTDPKLLRDVRWEMDALPEPAGCCAGPGYPGDEEDGAATAAEEDEEGTMSEEVEPPPRPVGG